MIIIVGIVATFFILVGLIELIVKEIKLSTAEKSIGRKDKWEEKFDPTMRATIILVDRESSSVHYEIIDELGDTRVVNMDINTFFSIWKKK